MSTEKMFKVKKIFFTSVLLSAVCSALWFGQSGNYCRVHASTSAPGLAQPLAKNSPGEMMQGSFPCVLILQEETRVPYNYALLTGRLKEGVTLKDLDGKKLAKLMEALRGAPFEIEWDHYCAHPFVALSPMEKSVQTHQGVGLEKPPQTLCCLEPGSIFRLWIKMEDVEKFQKIFVKEDSISWKIEGCQARGIEKAKTELRKKLIEKARTEASQIAETIGHDFIGFKQLVFNSTTSTPFLIQGATFEFKEPVIPSKDDHSLHLCPMHSANATEKIECVCLFAPTVKRSLS